MTHPPDRHDYFQRTECIADHMVNAADLLRQEFEPLHWNIEGILPAGTMLLAGKPKKGKSFLCLLIAISVAARRPVFGQQTSGLPVLYLGLEDSRRRLQRRLVACMNSLGTTAKELGNRLTVSTSSKRIDTGLIEELRDYLTAFDEGGVIVIDMLKKITATESRTGSLYEQQADVGHALSRLAHAHPALSILVVHHSNKANPEDPFDMISGTTGPSGSFDNLAVIADTEGARVLHTTGRDIEGAEIPLLMDKGGMYTLAMPHPEELATATMSDTRKRVYQAVPKGVAYKRADIISGSGLSESDVDQQLRLLIKEGYVVKVGRGEYQKTAKRWYDDPVPDGRAAY